MITENKLKHMLGVARKCYELAKQRGESEKSAREYFLMGFLHDIGYEFAEDAEKHEEVGYNILNDMSYTTWKNILNAIADHGNSNLLKENTSIYLQTLVEADFSIGSNGESCTIEERLEEIKNRSSAEIYELCKKQATNYGLLEK